MLVYGILMLIGGFFLRNKAEKLELTIANEEDKDIREALVRSIEKRKRTAITLISIGSVLTLIGIIILSSISFL